MNDDAVIEEFYNLLLDVQSSMTPGDVISLQEWLYIAQVIDRAKRFAARLEDRRARWN